jgi:hypothetical protein
MVTMGVNSDDGFELEIGHVGHPDVMVAGRHNGGRGSSDTTFLMDVRAAGIYPARIVYFSQIGGASLELFTVNADGDKVLLNDTDNGGLAAYRAGTVPPYVAPPEPEEPAGPATLVASSDGALSAPTVVDFGALEGDASYEFHFTAIKAGASTAVAGDNAFAIKLDQWNEQGVFGTTAFGVADNLFTAVEGGSVNSVFDAPVHVVVVSDTAAGESHLYIDGALSGTWAGNVPLSGDTKVMGARLEQATDHMGEGSVMHSWATYSGLLTAAEIASKFEALPDVSTGGGGGGEVDLRNGLVALWNFDNGSFDDAIGGFNGEERGAAAIGFTEGPDGYGSALALDGVDQFVEITGGAPEDLTFEGGSMTLSAWFRIGGFDKGWQALVAKGEGDRWRVHRRGGEGGLAHAGGIGEGPAGADISQGEWHHLVAITDGDAAEFATRLYIDGEIYSEKAGTPSLGENGKRVMIGGNPDTGNRTWNGDIDDVALWSRALSGAEVASLFADGPIIKAEPAGPAILPLDGVPDAGSGLDGRYWQAGVKSIDNLQDKGGEKDIGLSIIHGTHPTGVFKATGLTYSGGNDLTPVREWLQGDGDSYVGGDGNMDDGILSFTGYIRIDNPGELDIRSESDDGSVVWIAGTKVVDNDGGHGAPGPTPDGSYNFATAGLYPVEIAWYNGDWTNDAGDHGGANLNVLAGGNPIPGAILYSASDVGAAAIGASSITEEVGDAGLVGSYWTSEPKGMEFGEDGQGPIFQVAPGDDHGLALMETTPQGAFVSSNVNYTGNDLPPIVEWLADDGGSFIGTEGNLDDGLIQFKGYINIAESGQHAFRSASDDGSVVWIGNQKVVDNDGGHGAPGPNPDGSAFFATAGFYPIEVAWFNGDWTNDAGDHGGANIDLTMNGDSLAGHLFQLVDGLPQVAAGEFSSILVDFGGTEGSGAGASPSPWVTIDGLVQDESVDLGGGVTLTALDDGFTANNPAPPNEGAEYAGVMVPQEARNDYLFKNTDTAGTDARMQITGLPAGSYNVTVFEGRTTDASQFAKIWAGDGNEPDAENTGTFAGGHATVTVTVAEGETLWYKHLEDNSGGVSGMIIQAAGGSAGTFGAQDFEGLVLGASIDEEVARDDVWTKVAPDGWEIDDTGVPGVGTDLDGVTEWAGWSFANKDWWVETAGDQNRSQFTLGTGTIAIADGDEWDDQPHAEGFVDTFLSWTLDVSGAAAGALDLHFDSSWRPEFDSNYHQTANITVSYDGGDATEVMLWESDKASANYKPDSTNESVVVALGNPAGASSAVITFGYFDAGNDWWWAIDNIKVVEGASGAISAVTLQDGNITIEYTGTLKTSGTINGEFSAVDGASSPYSVAADQAQAFFIAE